MIAILGPVLHWLAVHTGSESNVANKPWYNFWSGFGSDMGEYALVFTLLAGLFHTLAKDTCHVGGQWPHGCWLPSFHEVDVNGIKHRVCHRHSGHLVLRHHPLKGLHHENNQGSNL